MLDISFIRGCQNNWLLAGFSNANAVSVLKHARMTSAEKCATFFPTARALRSLGFIIQGHPSGWRFVRSRGWRRAEKEPGAGRMYTKPKTPEFILESRYPCTSWFSRHL